MNQDKFMSDQKTIDKIKEAIEEIQPSLEMHGGGVELVEFDDKKGELILRIQGACVGCPMAQFTFNQGIEISLREKFPEIKNVVYA